MPACLFRRCPRGHDRTPTIIECAAPQSSERQRGGLANCPVCRHLVRRLLNELPAARFHLLVPPRWRLSLIRIVFWYLDPIVDNCSRNAKAPLTHSCTSAL